MKFIINGIEPIICKMVPEMELVRLSAKKRGQLWLDPGRFLAIIQADILARWPMQMAKRLSRPRLRREPGGRPSTYRDESILLMAIVQTAWRMLYADIIDYVASHDHFDQQIGFGLKETTGQIETISQGYYWERRAALGNLPILFFFLGLVVILIRLGLITGQELIVGSSLLAA